MKFKKYSTQKNKVIPQVLHFNHFNLVKQFNHNLQYIKRRISYQSRANRIETKWYGFGFRQLLQFTYWLINNALVATWARSIKLWRFTKMYILHVLLSICLSHKLLGWYYIIVTLHNYFNKITRKQPKQTLTLPPPPLRGRRLISPQYNFINDKQNVAFPNVSNFARLNKSVIQTIHSISVSDLNVYST